MKECYKNDQNDESHESQFETSCGFVERNQHTSNSKVCAEFMHVQKTELLTQDKSVCCRVQFS